MDNLGKDRLVVGTSEYLDVFHSELSAIEAIGDLDSDALCDASTRNPICTAECLFRLSLGAFARERDGDEKGEKNRRSHGYTELVTRGDEGNYLSN